MERHTIMRAILPEEVGKEEGKEEGEEEGEERDEFHASLPHYSLPPQLHTHRETTPPYHINLLKKSPWARTGPTPCTLQYTHSL
jgi:hypothetical protein